MARGALATGQSVDLKGVDNSVKCALLFALGFVAFHVEGQMVRAGEAAIAHPAFEWLGARVFADVTCELVGTREPPLAGREVAKVWLLTWRNNR